MAAPGPAHVSDAEPERFERKKAAIEAALYKVYRDGLDRDFASFARGLEAIPEGKEFVTALFPFTEEKFAKLFRPRADANPTEGVYAICYDFPHLTEHRDFAALALRLCVYEIRKFAARMSRRATSCGCQPIPSASGSSRRVRRTGSVYPGSPRNGPICLIGEEGAHVGTGAVEQHQLLGASDRQEAQEDLIEEGEDRRVGADAETQRGHHEKAEARVLAEHPERVAQVLDDSFHESSTSFQVLV